VARKESMMPTSAKGSILVTGDAVLDQIIYSGNKETPDSTNVGTLIKTAPGGALLLHDVLEHIVKTLPSEERPLLDLGVDRAEANFSAELRNYALAAPFSKDRDGKELVWRISRLLGYGAGSGSEHFDGTRLFVEEKEEPTVMVLDDAKLVFRFEEKLWPRALRQKESPEKLKWIVLKMSYPIMQGDLWYRIASRFTDKLLTIVSVDNVRSKNALVPKGISWEQTVEGLIGELNRNPAISGLLRSRHLVVYLRSEGALWVDRDAGAPYRLIFDPEFMEGEWGKKIDGLVFGSGSCLAASIALDLSKDNSPVDLEKPVKSGLSAFRMALLNGYGAVSTPPSFPFDLAGREVEKPSFTYSSTSVPYAKDAKSESSWTIVGCACGNTAKPVPMYGIARRVARTGSLALGGVPHARFGKLFTVDRSEIENLRTLRRLILAYSREDKPRKPLSIAAFGPPGSGKSFSIKQMAIGALGKDVPFLEFNLSQFGEARELIGAFHQVRDKVLEGTMPLVFWDEFDSKEYMWLQYLLAPMQDGKFQEGQITHPIGKCVFVFAGGTSYDWENFSPSEEHERERYDKFKFAKGPDFASRLRGYLNVLGPNRRQKRALPSKKWEDDPSDLCFPIRRAFLIRSALGVRENESLPIKDAGLLSAFLETDRYLHGARSLETLLLSLQKDPKYGILRSDLPGRDIMSMHVNYDDFMGIADRSLAFQANADALAEAIHETWRRLNKEHGWTMQYDMPYERLPESIKADNLAAAMRIPKVLELAGLYVVPEGFPRSSDEEEVGAIIEENLEILAEEEHEGWMEFRAGNGWRFGTPTDRERKISAAMRPYHELDEQDRERDRDSVRHFSGMVKIAKHKIVMVENLKPTDAGPASAHAQAN
jgi:hypothetical protein